MASEALWAWLKGRVGLPPDASNDRVLVELRRIKETADAKSVPAEGLLVALAREKVTESAGRVTFVKALGEVTREYGALVRRYQSELPR